MKHWNLGIFGYWVIGAGFQIEKDLESSPSLPNCSKDYWKLLSLLTSINWPSLVTSWFVVQKIYSKMHLVSCTNTHRDVTDLVNHGMAKNTKTWISWERKIIFRRNKTILNLCFRWHILRIYRFVAEVTFNITLPSLIVQLVIAKAGITFSVLHVFMDLISAWVLIYSVFICFLCGEYMFWWMYDGPLGFKFLFLPYNLQAT